MQAFRETLLNDEIYPLLEKLHTLENSVETSNYVNNTDIYQEIQATESYKFFSSYSMAKSAANKVKNLLEKANEDNKIAFKLNFDGNSCKTVGHSVGIIAKNGIAGKEYYFVDSSLGVFLFNDLNEYTEFLTFTINNLYYSTIFNKLNICNFLLLEKDFPMPENLKNPLLNKEDFLNGKRDENERSLTSFNSFRDYCNFTMTGITSVLYNLSVVANAVTDVAKSKLGYNI